jgi:hypothetical protein
MRGGRSFLILMVIALGLGAYIYFVESKREPAGDTAAAKKEKVFSIDSAKLDEIEVKSVSGETTTLKKKDGAWEITAPEPMPTDSSEVGGLVSTIESLEIQNVVDQNPKSAAEFGLEPPRFTVAFKQAGATAPTRLQLGRKTPTGGDLYARVEGQPRVFLISGFIEDSLNKTAFKLRDKTILKFERDAADSLMIEKADGPAVALAKKGSDWRFTKPYDAKADFNLVDGIVGKLNQAKMTSIETADGSKDLKKYGLDKPQVTATVGAGSARATLALGAKKDDGSLYARDMSRPMIFTVDGSLADELKKGPDDLRRKELFEFKSFSAQHVEVTMGGQTYVFEKPKAAESAAAAAAGASPSPTPSPAADVWKQIKPTAKDIDQAKFNDFLTTVSALRAEKFADKALTSGDEMTVSVKFGDASATEQMHFRKSGGVVHAIRAGDAGAAIVPTADYDKAVNLLKDIAGIK